MTNQPGITNMALFCDFENVALGVRDAKYAQFDIKKVLERLLLKGSIAPAAPGAWLTGDCPWRILLTRQNTIQVWQLPH